MFLSKYSDKSFVVTGNTKDHKDELKELGGRYNSKLSCGSGWIFSLSRKDEIESWIRKKQSSVIWNAPKEVAKEPKEEQKVLVTPVLSIIETSNDDMETIFNNFVSYIRPFYKEDKKLKDLLSDFIENQKHYHYKNNEEVDFYFSNDTTRLYDHFYTFLSISPVKHSMFQQIDKDKFIEHALIKLMM